MNIVVVCTGNVARSPVLACLLAASRSDLTVESAAVGKHAVAGARMRPQMRKLLHKHGYGQFADAHRSRLLADCVIPDLYIAVAPVHMTRLAELAPDVPALLTEPIIGDPAWGKEDAYLTAWQQILEAVGMLTCELPMAAANWSGE